MIIFDLDDCLALCEHRRHFVDPKRNLTINGDSTGCWYNGWKPDWKSFYEACSEDKPNEPIISLFHSLHRCERKVQIWSGRCESVHSETELWLLEKANVGWCTSFCIKDDLKMRPIGDSTSQEKLFESWYDLHNVEHPRDNIEMVFSAHQLTVNMFRRRGITCLQVAPGHF